MDLATAGLLIASFVLGLLGQGATDYALGRWHTIPRIRREVRQDCEAIIDARVASLEAKLSALTPATLRGGVEPSAAANMRWAREQDRARVEVQILAHLADLLGPDRAKLAWGFFPKNVRDAALRAGDDWQDVLDPMLALVSRKVKEHMGAEEKVSPLSVWGQV